MKPIVKIFTLLVPLIAACSDPAPVDDFILEWDGSFEVEPPAPPVLAPCPEGWVEVPPASDDDVPTCEPWPEGDPVDLPTAWGAPTPAVLTPCPEGWREVVPTETDGVTTCDPWPTTGRAECGPGEAHFPGEAGCAPMGPPCPAVGDWADDLPEDGNILFVRAGEFPPTGGDGTRERPFGTIGEATEAAADGTIIAVARGTYDEAVEVPRGVTLWGACVAETLLTCSDSDDNIGTVSAGGRDAELRNATISGERPGVLAYGGAVSIDLQNVVVSGARAYGLIAVIGTITGRTVVIRDTRSRERGRDLGRGIQAFQRAQVTLERVIVEDNRDLGVLSGEVGTTVTLSDAAILDTAARDDGRGFGRGLHVQDGGVLTAARITVEGNRDVAVAANNDGSVLTLEDAVVRDTASLDLDASSGRGANIQFGARLETRRVLFERNRTVGVYVGDYGSEAILTDTVVRDTATRESDEQLGMGLQVGERGTAECERVVFEDNHYVGVYVIGEGAALTLTDAVVRRTQPPEADLLWGHGLQADSGARLDVRRALLEGNHGIGLAAESGATLAAMDIVIRGTATRVEDETDGVGLAIGTGATGSVLRAVIEGNSTVGVAVRDADSEAILSDLVVRNTRCRAVDLTAGQGLRVRAGSRAEVTNALFEGNREVAVIALGYETSLQLSDAVIRDTLPRDSDRQHGSGLSAQGGADVAVRRVLFDHNISGGLAAFGDNTTLSVADVVVRDTESQTNNGAAGVGLQASTGSDVTVDRAVFERNREVGVLAANAGTELQLLNTVVRDTRPRACADTTCAGAGVGTGVAVLDAAHVDLTSFLVTRNAMCGLQITRGTTTSPEGEILRFDVGGTLDAASGEVSYNAVCGANVTTEDFDIQRLTDHVIYRENQRNLAMDEMSVPSVQLPALP